MKFLVDNQLPAALARFLSSRGHDAQHVLDLQMDEADDPDIWNHAAARGRVLVSKDEDFLHLPNRPGAAGAFVWVRLGNCRKQVILPHLNAPCRPSSRHWKKAIGWLKCDEAPSDSHRRCSGTFLLGAPSRSNLSSRGH